MRGGRVLSGAGAVCCWLRVGCGGRLSCSLSHSVFVVGAGHAGTGVIIGGRAGMTDTPLSGAEMCTALRDARTVFYCPCLGIRIARTGGSMLPVLCCLYCTALYCTVLYCIVLCWMAYGVQSGILCQCGQSTALCLQQQAGYRRIAVWADSGSWLRVPLRSAGASGGQQPREPAGDRGGGGRGGGGWGDARSPRGGGRAG